MSSVILVPDGGVPPPLPPSPSAIGTAALTGSQKGSRVTVFNLKRSHLMVLIAAGADSRDSSLCFFYNMGFTSTEAAWKVFQPRALWCKIIHTNVRTRLIWRLLDMQHRAQKVSSHSTSVTSDNPLLLTGGAASRGTDPSSGTGTDCGQ